MTQIMGLNLNLGSTEQPPPPFALFCSLQFSPLPHSSRPQKPASFPLASCRASVSFNTLEILLQPVDHPPPQRRDAELRHEHGSDPGVSLPLVTCGGNPAFTCVQCQ